jgi:predicted dehydrogenase
MFASAKPGLDGPQRSLFIMQRLRLGIVGPGLIWKHKHEPVLRQMGDLVELTAFSASSQRSREAVAADYPGVPFYFDYRELIASPKVDAVAVLTPIALNAPVAKAALEAGKDVIMEKPMARSVAEALDLIAAADKAKRSICVLEQDGYRADTGLVADLITAGEIGDLVMFDRVSHFRQGIDPEEQTYAGTPWRINAEFPLGTLFDGGHHNIAQLTRLFGVPKSVIASGFSARAEYGEFDQVLMMFQYEGAMRGTFSQSGFLGKERNYFNIRGTRALLEVRHGGVKLVTMDGEREYAAPRRDPWDVMWRAFLHDLREDREPLYGARRGLQDLAILETIAQAARQGCMLPIPRY